MKQIFSFALMLLTSCCIIAKSDYAVTVTKIETDSLPDISHIIDLKMIGGKIAVTYEVKDGFGQRILQEARFNQHDNRLTFGNMYGKLDNGYYQLFMPYLVGTCDGDTMVVSQDDGELLTIGADHRFKPTGKYILSSDFSVPYPISLYVQAIQMVSPEKYIFIGREPNGGKQSVFMSDVDSLTVTEIRPTVKDERYPSWTVNIGELVLLPDKNLCAFAYRLHPVIEFFNLSGETVKTHTVDSQGFDPKTIEMADMENFNPLQFIDLTQTDEYLYAVYSGKKYADMRQDGATSKIYKFNHSGDLITTVDIPAAILNIVAIDDNNFIAWNGIEFLSIIVR